MSPLPGEGDAVPAHVRRASDRWQVPDSRPAGRGWNGRDLQGSPHSPQRAARHQDHAAECRRRRSGPAAFLTGSANLHDDQASQSGDALRLRSARRWLVLHGVGVHRRREHSEVDLDEWAGAPATGYRNLGAGAHRTRSSPFDGFDPSRYLAGEHHAVAGPSREAAREGHRLRDRQVARGRRPRESRGMA